MRLALIGGFLGSGKTSAIIKAYGQLADRNHSVAVITNDQGNQQVDTELMRSLGLPVEEVVNGCFCCNYPQLDEHIEKLRSTLNPDYIFAESVGSCTDLIATLAKPIARLKKEVQIVISVFADAALLLAFIEERVSFLNEGVRYIYQNQLKEADVLLISKTDLIRHEELEKIQVFLKQQFPDKILLDHSSYRGADTDSWINAMDTFIENKRPSLDIDYALYAQGEADLAWLDRSLTLNSPSGNAVFICEKLIGALFNTIQQQRLALGHLKFFIRSEDQSTKVSFTSSSTSDRVRLNLPESQDVTILVNARIQTRPGILSMLMDNVVKTIESTYDCSVRTETTATFSPGYPVPTHRDV